MSKKKVENLLKGVAITGASVSGASILGDANLAYAAELGEEQAAAVDGAITIEVAHEQSREIVETTVESAKEEATEEQISEEEITEKQTSEEAIASLSAESSNIESTSESVVESLSAEDSEISSISTSAQESLTSENEQIASTSVSNSEELAVESQSLSTAVSEADAAFESASTSFSEAGKEDEYLENLIKEIEKAQVELKEAQEVAKESGQNFNHDSKSNNYYGYGDKLANLLIQYSFYQEGYVGDIVYSEWDSSNYNTNSVKVTYVDATGATKYAYFDYVTVDKDGNALVSGFYDSPQRGKEHDNPNVVGGIMVVKKTTEYKDAYGRTLTWDYSTETDANGVEKTVCHYYVDGKEIAPEVDVTINEDDTFTLSWEDRGDSKTVAVTEENQNPWYNSYIYDAADGTVYHDLGHYSNGANQWNNDLSGYVRNSQDKTVGVVEQDAQGNTSVSTLVDKNGKALNIVTKRPDYNNPDQWTWNNYYSAFSVGGKSFYYYNSRIINNHDGTYTLTGYYDENGASYKQQSVTLYTSASAATISLDFNPTFVSKKIEATDIYHNNAGQAKDGNFGIKGYTYFSEDDFNKGKDEYHEQRSELTSLSESASAVTSESSSWSESVKTSESASESASDSRSQSLFESAKVSESVQTSRSQSLSTSASESASMSTSISESLSMSLSQYISESISARESAAASTSSSESESTSESVAESEKESESESIRVSESESRSESVAESEKESESESIRVSESESTSESVAESEKESESESIRVSESESTSESVAESEKESESESIRVSESESRSESVAESERESESVRISESTRVSESESTSESIVESESISASVSASLSESLIISESESAAASESIRVSESVRLSESESASMSLYVSLSLSESMSNWASERASLSASELASTSTSTSESVSASESVSRSESVRESESVSTSESVRESESASTSESIRESESVSTSESVSASESASAAASTSTSADEGTGASQNNSAAEVSEVTEVIEAENGFNEVSDNRPARSTASFNELDEEADTIIGEQVPLSVKLDEIEDLDELFKPEGKNIVTIGDDETPLGVTKSGLGGRVWWYWILIIISAITGKIAKDKRTDTKNTTESDN